MELKEFYDLMIPEPVEYSDGMKVVYRCSDEIEAILTEIDMGHGELDQCQINTLTRILKICDKVETFLQQEKEKNANNQ